MSLGYADRLKNKRNLGGQLGAKEYHQGFEDIQAGAQSLAEWISKAERVFIFTGAGISTACGIPDFRGPNGIWTLRRKKAPLPTDLTPFEYAKPSFTHMAISGLVAAGKAPYVCSQNVDSLHLWSGVPRGRLAELHGNCFAERCTVCRTEYDRDFQMETVDFKPSGRRCRRAGCGGALVDNILDWDTPLPEDELEEAVRQAEEADVALVLGTSLQIQPANEIPTLTRDEGGKMVIVNLQKTPKDRKANLIIRSRVDVVMALLMQRLGILVPPYVRTETLVVEPSLSAPGPPGPDGTPAGLRSLTLLVRSRHGRGCPIPMVESLSATVSATEPASGGVGGGSEAAASGVKVEASPSAEVAEPSPDGQAVAAGAASGAARSWGPVHSGTRTPPPGGPTAPFPPEWSGGYTLTFTGIPAWVRRVRCTLQVRLVRWADPDKRDVMMEREIDLDTLADGNAAKALENHENTDGRGGTSVSAPKPEQQEEEGPTSSSGGAAAAVDGSVCTGPPSRPFCPPGDTAAAAGAGATTAAGSEVWDWEDLPAHAYTHTFVSQRQEYDPAEVVAAFLADPPPVVLPEPPRKRKKQQGEQGEQGAEGTGAGAAAAAAVPRRTSARRTRASYKAREAANETGTGEPGSSGSKSSSRDSEDGAEEDDEVDGGA